MEEFIKAVILGIIQGLTEYLPISSSAHLRIIPSFFGWKDIGAAYTAVIQVGTMAAIIVYFWKDLSAMTASLIISLKKKDFRADWDTKLFILIATGTIPILVFGYLLKDFIRNDFRNMYVAASSLIVFSIVIFIAERTTKNSVPLKSLKVKDSLIIGLFQSIALIPGTSRSGATIAGGFFRNMNRENATRFSFLLSIPSILISGLYELYSERNMLFSADSAVLSLITATIVSGIVGYLSIWFLLSYVRKHTLMLFIVYRIIFGVLILALLSTKVINN